MFLINTIPLNVYVGKTLPPEKGVLLNNQRKYRSQVLCLQKFNIISNCIIKPIRFLRLLKTFPGKPYVQYYTIKKSKQSPTPYRVWIMCVVTAVIIIERLRSAMFFVNQIHTEFVINSYL